MSAVNLEQHEQTITGHILSLTNTAVTPNEPLVGSVFNMIDEAMRADDTPHALPGVGLMHEGETLSPSKLLDESEQEGREHWRAIVLCDAPDGGGGIRGPRGAYTISQLIVEGLQALNMGEGFIRIDSRRRYEARNENGELLPLSGYLIDFSYPVTATA